MMRTITLLVATMCAATKAGPPDHPLVPDEHTLLLAHFDKTPNADHALGISLADGGGTPTPKGRFDGAIFMGKRDALTFGGKGNFPGAAGTVEFWIQPRWGGNDGQVRHIFDAGAKERDKISINKLASGRFGIGMFGTPVGTTNFVYRRADHDISAWEANGWHHVAACWQDGELALWLDGRKVASQSGALPPQVEPEAIRIQGGDFVIDELCISRVSRYFDGGRLAARPVSPRMQPGYGWRFNEPPGTYRCTPPKDAVAEGGVIVLSKGYLDDADPSNLPPFHPPRVELFASPGETEPATLLIVAGKSLRNVSVHVSDLKGKAGPLAGDRVIVRRVVRTPMRKIYTAKRSETDIVGRFLPRWQPLDIPAGEFRETWLEFRLPENLAPGRYEGRIVIKHSDGECRVPLQLDALPIRLVDHPRKALASYHTMGRRMRDRTRTLRELGDMRDHGIRNLFAHVGIQYGQDSGRIAPDFTEVREGLELLRLADFRGGTVVLDTSFPTLARMLGHEDLGKGDGSSLDGDVEFHRIAKDAMLQFLRLQGETPDFRLFLSHLDEVFGSRKLLDQYIRLSRAARQTAGIKLYITFNSVRDEMDAWRKDLDPFVDLRCNHGYSFELWLARGHTMDEYDQELKASGDEAWFYHNARGTYWTPEWSRIINGVYLWASPFTAHCPWTYQAYFENPFDDTDGPESKGHDWGLSFPGPDDPADLVPTRSYEAMREGGDDLRYIATLEKAISNATGRKPAEAASAQRFLEDLRRLIRNARSAPREVVAAQAPAPGAVDADTGLIMGQGAIGTAGESPLINALAVRFDGDHWQSLRREIADWIVKLQ